MLYKVVLTSDCVDGRESLCVNVQSYWIDNKKVVGSAFLLSGTKRFLI